ncbi:MAG: hypothetical protein KDD22_05205, partial [Bdellovibrionales bacterium]|nr:hypothetical protein [Bdellovibrionales bacterium]
MRTICFLLLVTFFASHSNAAPRGRAPANKRDSLASKVQKMKGALDKNPGNNSLREQLGHL